MSGVTRWVAAAVAVGFAGAASAADPVRPAGFFGGYFPGNGWNPYPYPYPNPGPFPPRPVPFPPRVDFDFVVVYKTSPFAPARVYGRFETSRSAQAAAFRLEAFGYATRIVPVRDYDNGFAW